MVETFGQATRSVDRRTHVSGHDERAVIAEHHVVGTGIDERLDHLRDLFWGAAELEVPHHVRSDLVDDLHRVLAGPLHRKQITNISEVLAQGVDQAMALPRVTTGYQRGGVPP